MRDVADVRVAVERKRVVLADREALDRAFDDLADVAVGAAMALGRKGGEELGVALVPGGGVKQRAQVALGGCEGAGGVELHAERLEDLGRVTLELLPLLRRDLAGLDLLPLGGLFRVESESGHLVGLLLAQAAIRAVWDLLWPKSEPSRKRNASGRRRLSSLVA